MTFCLFSYPVTVAGPLWILTTFRSPENRWLSNILPLFVNIVKQNFGLRQPIGRTLNAVLFHIYAVFIAYLILQILRHLLGGEYTGLSMLKFRRELQYSDALRVIMPKPPPDGDQTMENGTSIVSPLFYCELSVFFRTCASSDMLLLWIHTWNC